MAISKTDTLLPCHRSVRKDRGYSTPIFPRVYTEPCNRPAVLILTDSDGDVYDRSCTLKQHSKSLYELAADAELELQVVDLRTK